MSAIAITDNAVRPPATTTKQQTIARISMQTTPIIERLSTSLDHWQFLYILAITVALLSTFAIVIFAFHIEQHRLGLKISNYVYVLASVLAVLSTIVIVTKTKSLDAEKDRVAGVQISQAGADASQANEKAREAQRDADEAKKATAQIERGNLSLQSQLKKDERQLTSVNARTAPRVFSWTMDDADVLRESASKVHLVANNEDSDGRALSSSIQQFLVAAGMFPTAVAVIGTGSADPILVPGVHIRFRDQTRARSLAAALDGMLVRNKIQVDSAHGTALEMNPDRPGDQHHEPISVVIYIGPRF
jgi:hypothetical protein